jgi:glycerol transport system ATP-binding protein
VAARVVRLQDVGTSVMLTAELQNQPLKVRLSPEAPPLIVGDTVWLQLLGPHSCFYVNEERVS